MTDRNRWWSFSWNWGSATKNAQAQPRHHTIHSNQSSRNEALKNFNKSTYLLQPHHLLLFPCLSSACTWWERSSSPVNFSSKNATCVRWIVLKINFIFFFICFLFFLNPQNPNDHHLHQHSQTLNDLPIVWCLTNNLLTSWSLILLNLNSSKKSPQSMSCLTTSQSISTFKVQLFFLSDQPIWQQNSSPNPSNSHQSSNSNLNSSVFFSFFHTLITLHISGITLTWHYSIMALIFKKKTPFFAYALPSICLCSSSKNSSPPFSISLSLSLTQFSSKVISIMALWL